ncbi:hypothetical protein H5410_062242 [Solanum commersonii]|uniref:Uncharacterized protein n=1 Tax=Solanum commersonii TaxID=4109 RepID=A0A9J5WB09_SOLCO|nr:hypothetical protein H5410_062242 [Solanum commersonii]
MIPLHRRGLREVRHLHVKVVDNPVSFSIGLTQDFGVNAGFMAKSEQVQDEKCIEELRSKRKKKTQLQFKKSSTMQRQATLKLLKEEVREKS